jgi:hypothetical protein
MGQLVEIVFESVPPTTATAIVRDIIMMSNDVRSIDVDGTAVSVDLNAKELVSFDASVVFVRLSNINIDGRQILNVGLRLLKTDIERYDIEISFDLDVIDKPSTLVPTLHSFAQDLAKRYCVIDYFGGLEPAVDENTRIFTGEVEGPFRFPSMV